MYMHLCIRTASLLYMYLGLRLLVVLSLNVCILFSKFSCISHPKKFYIRLIENKKH